MVAAHPRDVGFDDYYLLALALAIEEIDARA